MFFSETRKHAAYFGGEIGLDWIGLPEGEGMSEEKIAESEKKKKKTSGFFFVLKIHDMVFF